LWRSCSRRKLWLVMSSEQSSLNLLRFQLRIGSLPQYPPQWLCNYCMLLLPIYSLQLWRYILKLVKCIICIFDSVEEGIKTTSKPSNDRPAVTSAANSVTSSLNRKCSEVLDKHLVSVTVTTQKKNIII